MNFIIATVGTYESILLGQSSRLDIVGAAIGVILGLACFIWQLKKISKFEEKTRRMTKRISAVITKREKIQMKVFRSSKKVYRYLYTFTGLNEYEGVIFCDEELLLEKVHVEGETVTLLINEENPEEFWFEEEDEPDKEFMVYSVVLIFISLMLAGNAIINWKQLSLGVKTRLGIVVFGICLIVLLLGCIWVTIKVCRHKSMKMHMTKRINAVISDRWEPSLYANAISYKYIYTFKGLDEYEGVTFDDRSIKVKKKHEIGENVSLLINANNLEEFWFEEADDPWKKASALWSFLLCQSSFICYLYCLL